MPDLRGDGILYQRLWYNRGMTKLRDAIPENMTIAEASEFWDTHSVADYPSRVVAAEYRPDDEPPRNVDQSAAEENDWRALSLDSFQQDWDNPEDAVYDNWREVYGVPAG